MRNPRFLKGWFWFMKVKASILTIVNLLMIKGRSPAVLGLTFTQHEADEKKFPALCRSAPLGRHLCRTNTREFPSSVRSAIVRANIRRLISRIYRPDGAGDLFGCRFYKDVAPTALPDSRCKAAVSPRRDSPSPTAPLTRKSFWRSAVSPPGLSTFVDVVRADRD